MSDKFFQQLLQYREDLISHEFVADIINKIHRFEIIRTLIIGAFAISGLAFLGFSDITQLNLFSGINFEPLISEFNSEFKNTSTETVGFIMLATVCSLGFWLISSEQ